ncbi:MAG: hypothetical protein DLM55_11120 [Acidimicrobiales bacterium]|nr:MAG: hypothetical protein DLM55_11120 [Acidimicrobiales bacterium]
MTQPTRPRESLPPQRNLAAGIRALPSTEDLRTLLLGDLDFVVERYAADYGGAPIKDLGWPISAPSQTGGIYEPGQIGGQEVSGLSGKGIQPQRKIFLIVMKDSLEKCAKIMRSHMALLLRNQQQKSQIGLPRNIHFRSVLET